jgi:hypothetical protein
VVRAIKRPGGSGGQGSSESDERFMEVGTVLVRRWFVTLGAVALSAALLAACSSSSSPAQASGVRTTCQRVGAALADGPDPDADPVGYALAQILPLQQIKAPSDQPLQTAIDHLDTAYRRFYQANGVGQSAKQAVTRATDQLNTLCPGVAS